MTAPTPTACRSCGRPIHWAAHETTKKPMPVDAEPTPNGNVKLLQRGRMVICVVYGKEDAERERAAGAKLRLSHFVTCPSAGQHRKPKG